MIRTYSGDLAIKPLSLLADDGEREAWQEMLSAELERRIGLLFAAHGVTPGDFRALAWNLALDLPGFQEPRLNRRGQAVRRGQPLRWDGPAKLVLAQLFARLTHSGQTKREAAARLVADDPWINKVIGPADSDAIARQCSAKAIQAARKDRELAEQAGMLHALDAHIDDARRLMIEQETERNIV